MNKMLETMFMEFLETTPTSPLAAEMQRLSAIIDRQNANGSVDDDTIAAYELSAMRYGFSAGFAAAVNLLGSQQEGGNARSEKISL